MSKVIISIADAAVTTEHFVKEMSLSELMGEQLPSVVKFLLTGYNVNMQITQAALQVVTYS